MTKNCFYCGSHRTIKKSKENGYQRWFCKDCKRYFIGHRRLTSNYTLS
ncbi:IS1/IS1595 family N-terminal zinc-binding domain-containing protein [Prevotella melaninogenica]